MQKVGKGKPVMPKDFFLSFFLFFFLFVFCFVLLCLVLLLRATPVAFGSSHRRGVKSELQLPSYTTATVTPDLSRVCDLKHSPPQYILNLLSEARDGTCILMDTRVCFCCATVGNPSKALQALNSMISDPKPTPTNPAVTQFCHFP